jgi:hypothetical protein
MKNFNKKGQQAVSSETVGMIKMAATLLIMSMLIYAIWSGGTAEKASSTGACTTKVLLNAGIKVPIIKTELVNAKCDTWYYYIGLDKITAESSSGSKFDEKIKCPKNAEKKAQCFYKIVNEKLASLIYGCWKQFGAGKLDVYSGTQRSCAICSRVAFKDDVKQFMLDNGYNTRSWMGDDEKKLYFLDEYMRTHGPYGTEGLSYFESLKDGESGQIPDYYDYDVDDAYLITFKAEYASQTKDLINSGWHLVKCPGDWVLSKAGITDDEVCEDLKNDVSGKIQRAEIVAVNDFIRQDELKGRCDVLK